MTKQGFDSFHGLFDYPYPFGEVRPAVRPGVQRRARWRTPARHVHRGLRLPVARSPTYAYERRAETVLHEMAHMWFGDLVTMRWWDDLWLNESFATYASVLCQSRGHPLDRRLDHVRQRREDLGVPPGPAAHDPPDRGRHRRHRGGEGQLRRHHLRQGRVGAQAARRLGRAGRVLRRHPRATSSTRAATPRCRTCSARSSEASGRDLPPGPREWLQTAGVNTLRPEFEVDGDGTFTSFAVLQEAPADHPTLRSHRVAVGLYDRADGRSSAGASVEIDVVGAAHRGARAGRRARGPIWCWSTTTT